MEDAIAHQGPDADVRMIALREVQKARVSVDEKFKLFIPAGNLCRTHQLDEILAALNKEPQTATWNASLSSLVDFIRIPGRGIRFTCTSRSVAAKLGGTAVRIFNNEYIIKTLSIFDSMYFVDLRNVPSDLDDDKIYDYFAQLGLQPILTPTYQVGTLSSRDRTVWFNNQDCPHALMLDGTTALREIRFPGFTNVVYVHHKNRMLNTTPPSIIQRETERRTTARTTITAPKTKTNTGPTTGPSNKSCNIETPSKDNPAPCQPPSDPVLDIAKPEITAPFQEWVAVGKSISIAKQKAVPKTTLIPVQQTQQSDGRLIFGIPCTPTRFEIAFDEPEGDDDAEDTDLEVFEDDKQVSAVPLLPNKAVGGLISMTSYLSTPRTKLPRSNLRALAAESRDHFATLNEPEARIAAMTAQPHALQQFFHDPSDALNLVIEEHAVLRAYSGFPSTTHGVDMQLLPRMKKDFPDSIPHASVILPRLFPNPTTSDQALSLAVADLYLRTHAPALYHDPVKVAALTRQATPSCLQYSSFLLWSDEVLAALWASALGDHYHSHLPDYIDAAIDHMLRLDDNEAEMTSPTNSETAQDTPSSL